MLAKLNQNRDYTLQKITRGARPLLASSKPINIDHSFYKMASQPEDLEDDFEFESDEDSDLQDLGSFALS